MNDGVLDTLVRDAWQTHARAVGQPWLVTPSAPVLFFGDLTAYWSSSLRIVTVALNPSHREFPCESPFARFPAAGLGNMADYLASLERYFRVNPYLAWFDSYEQALSGLNASYYGHKPNAALHTDIGSVLATKPTWRSLNRQDRERIADTGVELWHRLIGYLKPEILLWSTARSWIDRIEFCPSSSWDTLRVFCETKGGALRKRPIAVSGCWYQLRTGEKLLVTFIPAAQKPLGTLSHGQKREAGETIVHAWKENAERT